ncbi:Phage tail protein [Alloalcanivorax xenomutans]|uniref:hypothetical protein n=1 Tax=Alloalcanivorax xenomutans TaxID=1094342 RepID=UPI0006D5C833|nr:hypothetical protein [Alloalcanivorax xenomutans]CUR45503.1 Phage tail protein [Alloalcanivorax xenomutans]
MADLKTQLILELTDRITRPARQVGRVLDRLKQNTGLQNLATQGRAVANRFSATTKEAGKLTRRVTVLSGAIAGAVWGVERLVSGVTNSADQVSKLSDRLGVNAQLLQEWQYAAQLSGVAQASFDMGLQRFIRRVAEAANGTGEARGALRFLNIELRDAEGNIRPAAELLPEVADGLAKVEDQGTRVRAAFKLFDSEGVAMLQMLQGGAEGLREMRREARATGAIMNDSMIRQSVRYTDVMTRFRKTLGGLRMAVVERFLPSLTTKLGELTDTLQNNQGNVVGRIVDNLKEFLSVLRSIGQALSWTADLLGGWGRLLGLVGAIMAGPIMVSLGKLTFAVWRLGQFALPLIISAVPPVIGAIKALSAALLTTPVGWVVAGIAAIAGAVYLIYRNWDRIAEWFTAKIDRVKSAFDDGLLNGVMGVIREFNPGRLILEAINGIVKHFTGIDLAKVGGDFIQNLWDGITARWRAMTAWLKQKVDQVVGWLPDWMTGRNGGGTSPAASSAGGRLGPPVLRDTDRPGAAQAQVGGLLRIQIDSEGQPRVRELRQEGGMEIEADTGLIMVPGS